MKRGIKILGALALVAAWGLTTNVLANCQDGNVYPIIQCGERAWFSATPSDAGPVNGFWWQLGYGARGARATDPGLSAANGTGFQGPIATGGGCIGNDSGVLSTTQELDLEDATPFGGPAGALCLGAFSNWITTGSDGCADNSKAGSGTTAGSLGGTFDDNLLNPYFGAYYGPGTLSNEYQNDLPMGVLLLEGTGKYFAAGFFATRSRAQNPSDADSGAFSMGGIVNGDPNPTTPGANNVIPWQLIPQPHIQAVFQDPGNPSTSPRILTISWDPVRVVHDGSQRPSGAPAAVNGNHPGVGVLDQAGGNPNNLIRFVIETAPAQGGGGCGTFAAALTVPGSQGTASLTVPPDTCVRMSTQFGATPQQTLCNQANASKGLIGDLGVSATSATTVVGGSLASNRITVVSARKNKNQTATIQFKTTSELNVTSLVLMGRNQKGQEFQVMNVSPKQGTTGMGDTYSLTVTKNQLKGARSIFIVEQPSGVRSNEITLGH